MRAPPSLEFWLRYPVTSAVGVLAGVVTLIWFGGADISFMFMDYHVWQGQVWRLVTSALPHVDLIHLAFNLYWLWVFGTLVEEVFGSLRTVGILLLFATGSAAAEYAIFEGGVGLSGVAYGLFGLLWVLSRKDDRFQDSIDGQTVFLFVAWFFLCIILTKLGIWRVGNVAHGMGGVLGVLVGSFISVHGYKRGISGGILALIMLLAFGLSSWGRLYVNLSPERWREFARRGYQDILSDHFENAVIHLRQAVELNDREANSWYNLGVAYQRLGNTQESADAFQTCL